MESGTDLAATKTSKLDKYKVGSIPTVFYIPEFISEEEEELLLKNVSLSSLPLS